METENPTEISGNNKTEVKKGILKKRSDALPPPPIEVIMQAMDQKDLTIEWLAGDGSDRCYYRIINSISKASYVLMQLSESDSIALKSGGYDWIKVAEILSEYEIPVPRLKVSLPEYAALIIEDYGDTMLESCVNNCIIDGDEQRLFSLYLKATNIIGKFLNISPNSSAIWCQRSFDSQRFQWEMDFFYKEYVEPIAGIKLGKREKKIFEDESRLLSEFLAGYSSYFVHRDFHSRNIMIQNDNLAIIDFQDARLGPPAYDLVSLCFDSYIPIAPETRLNLMENAIRQLAEKECKQEVLEIIENHWRPMLLQRQFKAIGSFGFLSLKKNRGNYLSYVRPALLALSDPIIADNRWPFLSQELVSKLRERLFFDQSAK